MLSRKRATQQITVFKNFLILVAADSDNIFVKLS